MEEFSNKQQLKPRVIIFHHDAVEDIFFFSFLVSGFSFFQSSTEIKQVSPILIKSLSENDKCHFCSKTKYIQYHDYTFSNTYQNLTGLYLKWKTYKIWYTY